MDQNLAEVHVAALADAEQLRLASGRVLAWDDAEPRSKVPAPTKGGAVADRRDDGRRHNRPDPGNLTDAGAPCIAGGDPFQLIAERFDLLFNELPLPPQHVDQVAELPYQPL